MNIELTKKFVTSSFSESVVNTLSKYIEIPNLSPAYDSKGNNASETEKVIKLFTDWSKAHPIKGAKTEVIRLQDDEGKLRTPIILIEVEAFLPQGEEETDDTVLLYGHMDKQPPFEGWNEGTGPYTPVIKDGRLYGRGGADDGYAFFASVTALRNCQEQGVPHPRCVILIESGEESGSPDLPFYVKMLVDNQRMKNVSLVVCLDSGAMSYDSLWITSSLRGILEAELTVQTLENGVHSGDGGGVCSDSFRICRKILDALEDSSTGCMNKNFFEEIPEYRVNEIRSVINHQAKVDGKGGRSTWDHFPLVRGKPMLESEDPVELLLNRTWRPNLTIVGQDGLPSCIDGGNVLRPSTTLSLSIRLPPSMLPEKAEETLRNLVASVHCHDAKVSIGNVLTSPGWDAPKNQEWLNQSLSKNANAFFGNNAMMMGEGGSIPFMGMLGDMFPAAQFVVTGVLGPESNAHGPNEFLDINYCQKVVCVVSHLLADHRLRRQRPVEEWSSNVEKMRGMKVSLSRVEGAAEDKLVAEKKFGA